LSEDHGRTWKEARLGFRVPEIQAIGAFPGYVLLAASATPGIFLSLDGGATWSPGTGLSARVTSLAIDRTPVIYAGTSGEGVLRAARLGASWTRTSPDSPSVVRALVALPSGPLVAASDRGVFVSSDQGTSWTFASQGLPEQEVFDLAVDAHGQV